MADARRVFLTGHPLLLAQAAALRREVFVEEQGVAPVLERDGQDASAYHAVVLGGDGRVLATGRLVDGGDHARLGRIAVRASARGTGAGAAVVRELETVASALGLAHLRLHAQAEVAGFYLRLGYLALGEPDLEAGLRHQWMDRHLLPGLRPIRDQDAAAVQDLIGGCFAEYPGCVLDLAELDAWMRRPATLRGALGDLWGLPGRTGLDAIAGWVPAGEEAELKSLYVSASARRQGYGAALVGVVERTVRQRGFSHLRLWSDSRFVDAHRLYRRLGYRSLDLTRRLDDPSDTLELAFAKDLEPAAGR